MHQLRTIITRLSAGDPVRGNFFAVSGAQIVFLGLCVLAGLRPFITAAWDVTPNGASVTGFPGWVAVPELKNLPRLKLSARDEQFSKQFPGEIAAFAEGRNIWIARWVAKPTRKLHPAADCLRATGYTVHPAPIFVDAKQAHWGAIFALRHGENLRVRERIIDHDGRTFTDVSAWYWAAVLDKSAGPWWCLTKIESDPVL